MSFSDLPKFDDLENKKRFWPAKPGSRDEGLGMLRYLTPAHVAQVVKSEVQTGERVSDISEQRRPIIIALNLPLDVGMPELGNDQARDSRCVDQELRCASGSDTSAQVSTDSPASMRSSPYRTMKALHGTISGVSTRRLLRNGMGFATTAQRCLMVRADGTAAQPPTRLQMAKAIALVSVTGPRMALQPEGS